MSIGLDPTYAKAYLRRAELRLKSGKRHLACDDFTQAQRLDPTGQIGIEAARRLFEERQGGGGGSNGHAGGGGGASSSSNGGGRRGGGGASSSRASATKSHYETLGVADGADENDIRKVGRPRATPPA